VSPAEWQSLKEQLRQMRLAGQLEPARELIRAQEGFSRSIALQKLLRDYQDFWWEPIQGRLTYLRRRGAGDADLVRSCWADTGFMQRFNRFARPLPPSDTALAQLLDREHWSTLSEARALHWTIHGPAGPVGFVSAVDVSEAHRRCEFLIGLKRESPNAAAAEAAALAIDFLHRRAGVDRITAWLYPENTHAVKLAEKFGFRIEGRLRGQNRSANGDREDALLAGLLISEIAGTRAEKMLRRFADGFFSNG
jgi:RimJ/RimL family protein N-acetyltransferase